MNFVQVAGFLGADAEERFTAKGKRVVSLRVAARVWQNGKEETIWWRVNIWDDKFDKLLPYLRKGTGVIIFGEMGKPETYVDREGKTQVSLTMTAEIIRFSPFGKTEKSQESHSASAPSSSPAQFNQYQSPVSSFDATQEMAGVGSTTDLGETSDDLPF